MRYIDNGQGDSREALFAWLQTVLKTDVVEIRCQSGFFEASVLGVFEPTFRRLSNEDQNASVLIGSNDGETEASAVHGLVDVLGLPRPNALLGVVRYGNAFYHPKTIHLRYRSGRQVAYVGSSNLTSRGVSGLNIEAGVVLDTEEGDPEDFLNQVGGRVSEWFDSRPDGLFEVRSHDDVKRLETRGILRSERADPRPSSSGGHSGDPLPSRVRPYALAPIPDSGRVDLENISGDVLIAELAGPGRWGQAAFPEWFVDSFFQVLPSTGEVLQLVPVTQASGVGAVEKVGCGYKEGSRNWYYELGLAAAIGAYPKAPAKPIGVFHRIDHQICRYTILMPDDEAYLHVDRCLAANRDRLSRPRNELRRTIVPAEVLRSAWPGSWFFEV